MADGSGQDQVEIAELVPEVAALDGGSIRHLQVLPPGDRREHVQVRGFRLVKSRQQRVHHADAALRCDDEARPAPRRDRRVPRRSDSPSAGSS